MKRWQRWVITINAGAMMSATARGNSLVAAICAAVLAGMLIEIYENRGN